MNVLFLCGREVNYPLNQTLIDSMREFFDVNVIYEHGSRKPILLRSAQVLTKALPHLVSNKYDLVFISFYGHLLTLPSAILTKIPTLFYPFISTFETLVDDRKIYSRNHLIAKLAFWLDRTSCRLADHILLDTQANINYFSSKFGIPIHKFHLLPIGCDERIFYPRDSTIDGKVIVIYHGAFLPLHGIDYVVQAANLLRNREDIQFHLIGNGLKYDQMRQLAAGYGLKNIQFNSSVPVRQLPIEIAKASIALGGHFGTSDKAARVIAGKTFQDLAMGKATIVGDGPANHELFQHGHDAWFCEVGNADALSRAILTLADDQTLRDQIGRNGRQTFIEKASMASMKPQLAAIIRKVVNHS